MTDPTTTDHFASGGVVEAPNGDPRLHCHQHSLPRTTDTDPDILIRARIFAASRVSAAVLCSGPETRFREGWFPRLARQFVRNADDPPLGYATRDEAVAAARRYRSACAGVENG